MGSQPDRTPNGLLAEQLEALRAPLMRFFLRRIRDHAEAEDLTQEALLRLVAAARRERLDDPQAFVFRISLNLLNDRGRKAQRRNSLDIACVDPNLVSEITHEFVEERTPERVLEGQAEFKDVLNALDELSERTRDVYVLFRLENMKHAEIASLFGISRSTVEKEVIKATLHLARRFGRRSR